MAGGDVGLGFYTLAHAPCLLPIPRGIGDEDRDVQFRWSPLVLVPMLLW